MVEDVPWNLKDENMFGSSEDDCKLIIWDLRTNKAQQSVKPHEKEVCFIILAVSLVRQVCRIDLVQVLFLNG